MPHKTGKRHHNWKGGRTEHAGGYVQLRRPEHPEAHNGYVFEHRIAAERALGKPLPPTAEIHHVNEDPSDNRPENLVVCEGLAYHKLLHRRTRAFQAAGNPTYVKCWVCGEYDDPTCLYVPDGRTNGYHRECRQAYRRRRREARRQS